MPQNGAQWCRMPQTFCGIFAANKCPESSVAADILLPVNAASCHQPKTKLGIGSSISWKRKGLAYLRQVLECGSPLPLWNKPPQPLRHPPNARQNLRHNHPPARSSRRQEAHFSPDLRRRQCSCRGDEADSRPHF